MVPRQLIRAGDEFLAEALLLGMHVIASDVGGHTDFCTGAYPCADGHVWGEPYLDHAATLMQQLAQEYRNLRAWRIR